MENSRKNAVLFFFLALILSISATNIKAQTPGVGDVIINEYASDGDANGNDFVEILTLTNGLDLRGLRITDNEYNTDVANEFNGGEGVLIFDNETYLQNVPRGTVIAVYTGSTGITTDTTVNPGGNDFFMTLAPGTGVTQSADGLPSFSSFNLATAGDDIYLYLPGPNGNSTGTDNVYLDHIRYDGGSAGGSGTPPGITTLDLTGDNAQFQGNTAAGSDVAGNWVTNNNLGTETPGADNTGQNLSSLRTTAASATISGKVLNRNGRALRFVTIMIQGNGLSEPLYATTNMFGRYQFEDLPVGDTYVLQVFSKRYFFKQSSVIVNLQDNIRDADFVGSER